MKGFVTIYDDAQQELKKSLGGYVASLLDDQDFKIFCEDGYDETDFYEHMRRGCCMLCGEGLGEDTLFLADEQGILALLCSGDCLRDMHVISWLEETLSRKLERLDPNNKGEPSGD